MLGVSILITLINHIITPVIQLMNLLPQSPGASKSGSEVTVMGRIMVIVPLK